VIRRASTQPALPRRAFLMASAPAMDLACERSLDVQARGAIARSIGRGPRRTRGCEARWHRRRCGGQAVFIETSSREQGTPGRGRLSSGRRNGSNSGGLEEHEARVAIEQQHDLAGLDQRDVRLGIQPAAHAKDAVNEPGLIDRGRDADPEQERMLRVAGEWIFDVPVLRQRRINRVAKRLQHLTGAIDQHLGRTGERRTTHLDRWIGQLQHGT
jgi:hypothetical protein